MLHDRAGWHHAPAGNSWCCPECRILSSIDDWSRCTIIDDSDIAEDARLCPECGNIIPAGGSKAIASMTNLSASGLPHEAHPTAST